jgi:hypothetical protein
MVFTKKIQLALAALAFLIVAVNPSSVWAADRFFQMQAVDTMKLSRDGARNGGVVNSIPAIVEKLAALSPTHIAIATPYDKEFDTVREKWIGNIHDRNIKVWFRGNFSSWEKWFDYPAFTNPYDHIAKTYAFITSHPREFADGDIFTPAPEPENGGFGDPRHGNDIKIKFFDFLVKSQASCEKAFAAIHKNVTCGYFSTNGDVAELFPTDVVKKLGNVIVIDHYVRTPQELVDKAVHLHEKTGAQIILGEYGAPIPDLHGELTQKQQAQLIRDNLKELVAHTDIIKGINYWTAVGGSTSLYSDAYEPRLAASTLEEYFSPIVVTGQVSDENKLPLEGVQVRAGNLPGVQTNTDGSYKVLATADFSKIEYSRQDMQTQKFTIDTTQKTAQKNIVMIPQEKNLWYYLKQLMRNIGDSLQSFGNYLHAAFAP